MEHITKPPATLPYANPYANHSLVIACGALAHEIEAIKRQQPLHFDVKCLNANLHNYPERIPSSVEKLIVENLTHYQSIYVAYADCGTGGRLDAMLDKYGIERLPGAHCYEFFSPDTFASISDDVSDLGTFYLTDFLARHFDRLVMQELGIAQTPELRDMLFGHYHRVLYLIQNPNKHYREQAKHAAQQLGLAYEEKITGYGQLDTQLVHWHINKPAHVNVNVAQPKK
ncbi:DUF1638 domain-containing protein [Ostreibacterium oceani]|uniref:DUF1638 domain-containing protein n=1 Tax=Ostreibacterium oceani TaxID=2654998 RepID=A0A6N7EZ78_9GAMM|nr:DUF1638 domain-containing protein [Ostreibacterium oceani]MPV86467.1 DUF1638 domain-containing protein [Ostreibacterium oceani]